MMPINAIVSDVDADFCAVASRAPKAFRGQLSLCHDFDVDVATYQGSTQKHGLRGIYMISVGADGAR